MRSIKRLSFILNDYLKKLRQQTNEILPSPAAQRLESAANYVEELNTNLEGSKDIYNVKDQVLQEAKQKLDEITHWASSLIERNNGAESSSADETVQLNGTLNHSSFVSDSSSHDTSAESIDS